MYESSQFRFPMGTSGHEAVQELRYAAYAYVRYAPNQGGAETPRENIRSAFYIVRSRLNHGLSIQGAIGELDSIAHSYADM